jgi:hypothetical protein
MIPVRKGGRANLYRSEDSGMPSSLVINCIITDIYTMSEGGKKLNIKIYKMITSYLLVSQNKPSNYNIENSFTLENYMTALHIFAIIYYIILCKCAAYYMAVI